MTDITHDIEVYQGMIFPEGVVVDEVKADSELHFKRIKGGQFETFLILRSGASREEITEALKKKGYEM